MGQKCLILSQDEFYRVIDFQIFNQLIEEKLFQSEDDPNHEWLDISEGVKHQNWESMSSIDWHKFYHKLNEILRESASDSDRVVVIEGHLIFNYK